MMKILVISLVVYFHQIVMAWGSYSFITLGGDRIRSRRELFELLKRCIPVFGFLYMILLAIRSAIVWYRCLPKDREEAK